MNNKKFWDTLKPFMTNKGFSTFSNIAINDENEVLITDQNKLAETFNNHYINIVENSTGKKPSILGDPSNQENDKKTVLEIIDEYQNHPSILKIKSKINTSAESIFHIK